MTSDRAARLRGLYAITPVLADTHVLCDRVAQVVAGGASLVQYRAKDIDHDLALERRARSARSVAGPARSSS